MSSISVIKKNGSKENFDIEKIHKVVSWSVNGLSNVSQSDIEINAKLNIIDGITTEQIHSVLIDSAANLINEETPDYQYVAGRLLNYQIRKNVWGGKNPPKLVDLIKKNVDLKFYEPKLLEWYSAEEINKIDEFINHEQDFHYTYCSIKQLCDKYLVKNQFTSELFETPQFRYIVASMTLFRNYSKKTRLSYIKKAYNYFSKFKINLATPQLAGLGTNNNSYASCFPGKQLIELNGYSKQISEISLNDCVLSHEGNYRKVIAKADKLFTGNLITLDTSSTFKDYFQSTEDHLIYSVKKIKCIRNSKCGSCNTKKAKPNYCFKKENHYKTDCSLLNEEVNNPKWTQCSDLNIGDYVQIAFNDNIETLDNLDITDYLSKDIISNIEYNEDRSKIKIKHHLTNWVNRYLNINNDVLRLFGLFYAEGDANVDNAYVQFTLNNTEQHLHEFIINCFNNDFGIDAKEHQATNDNSYKIIVHSRVLSDFFVNFLSSGFDTKKINPKLMNLSFNKQKYLLKGLFEGDGFAQTQGIGIQLSNVNLINQIKQICLRGRLCPNIRIVNRKNATQAAALYLSKTTDFEFINFINKDLHKIKTYNRKIYVNGFWHENKYFSKILNIIKTPVENFKVYDIQVSEDESFSAAGIASHNCCLIEMLDDRRSINATNNAVANATCAGYGIGVNYGRMRGIGSSIKNGLIIHPGVVPFLKITEAETKAWQKNGLRGGSATVNFPIWHSEIETIVQLKNATTGTNDSRVFNLDYAIGLSKLFYERFLKNEDITLFSPDECGDLYDAFGLDSFDELYVKYENNKKIKNKKKVNARELFSLLVKERLESGRIYILNVDNANKYSSWIGKVNMSNLCMEILQNIESLKDIDDPNSEIGVCVLSAINWLEISSEEEMEKVCDVVVRMLDEIIDIQDYFDLAAKNFCQNKRSLGIGVTNLAAFLAKNKLKYTDEEAIELVDEWMEKQQYYLIKSSINLAKEKGKCSKFNTSKYSNGWLPIDKDINIAKRKYSMDWEQLRADIKEFGLRHTTFTAEMPVESSSLCQNTTNGVEPARALLTFKSSKKSSIPFLVPNVKSCGDHYQLAYDMENNIGYLNVCNAIQKWMDMGMSVNQYFNPSNYEDNKIPYSQIIKELIHFWKNGGKSFYYLNSEDGNSHFKKEEKSSGCESGACSL